MRVRLSEGTSERGGEGGDGFRKLGLGLRLTLRVTLGLKVRLGLRLRSYLSVEKDSSTAITDGESVAMMSVLHRPPSDSCSSLVSLLSRYGMRSLELFERSVEMTRPSVRSDWLMFLRSRSREAEPSPAAWWGRVRGG